LPKLESWTPTQRLEALASSLLQRYGVLTREGVSRCLGAHSDVPGFGALYPVLKAMEEVGRVRRGYFIAGLGATQFALPGCEDRLRDERDTPDDERSSNTANGSRSRAHCLVLAADDPANPYGASLPWPPNDAPKALRPSRSAGARVVLVEGALRGFIGRTGERLCTFLPTGEPERSQAAHALAEAVGRGTGQARGKRGGGAVVFKRIDGGPAADSDFAPYLLDAGFQPAANSLHRRLGAPVQPRPN
jgi:ATP-dependent Lhr-like helicase